MNNNVLISTAILSALWEKNKKDTLDLMLPFLKYSIAKNTIEGQPLDVPKITNFYKNEFGYKEIPDNVIRNMLNRLCSTILQRRKRDYILNSNLDRHVSDFEEKRVQCKEQQQLVIQHLIKYLKENSNTYNNIDESTAQRLLVDFFSKRGLAVIDDPYLLEGMTKNKNEADYFIGQFILDENKDSSIVFDYLVNMVKGFFISTAISLQPDNLNLSESNFNGAKMYIDTSIIINALGYNSDEEKDSTDQLFQMLIDKKAKLCCFEHNYDEIYDILSAYKYALTDPLATISTFTLDNLKEKKYTPDDIDRIIAVLRNKIETLGISIEPTPSYNYDNNDKLFIDEVGLANHIKSKMGFYKDEALERDIKSIASICILRNGFQTNLIEKCKALFITANDGLAKHSSNFLSNNGKSLIAPIVTDTNISSILWLKSYTTHKEYPKLKLIENAVLALEPSASLMLKFRNTVQQIKSEGGITEDEASILRTDRYVKRQLMELTHGIESSLVKETVFEIRARQKALDTKEVSAEAQVYRAKYEQEKSKNLDAIKNALAEVEKIGEEAKIRTIKKLSFFVWSGVITTFIIFAVCLIIGFLKSDLSFILASIVLLILNFIGLFDLVLGKKKIINDFIVKRGNISKHKIKEKKKQDYAKVLGTLDSEMIKKDQGLAV